MAAVSAKRPHGGSECRNWQAWSRCIHRPSISWLQGRSSRVRVGSRIFRYSTATAYFSGKPLVFRPQGTNWLLYSIGTDHVDDGGKPKGRGIEGKGDLSFDTPSY